MSLVQRTTNIILHALTDIGDIAGDSTTGDAEGGRGNGKGPGGNAYSGFAGPSRGGNVVNEAGTVDNTGGTSKLDILSQRALELIITLRHRRKWSRFREWWGFRRGCISSDRPACERRGGYWIEVVTLH